MDEAAAGGDILGGSFESAAQPGRTSIFAGRSNRPLRVLGFVIVFASVLVSSLSFLILSGTTNVEPSANVWTGIWVVKDRKSVV